MKNVFTQINCIYDSLQQATEQCDHNMASMSLLTTVVFNLLEIQLNWKKFEKFKREYNFHTSIW